MVGSAKEVSKDQRDIDGDGDGLPQDKMENFIITRRITTVCQEGVQLSFIVLSPLMQILLTSLLLFQNTLPHTGLEKIHQKFWKIVF